MGCRENNVLELNEAPSDLGLGDDEVMMATGDSGGPVFLDGAIAGISTSYLGQQPGDATPDANSSWGEMALDLRVSSQRTFIEQATQGKARFVPEPTTTRTAILALLFTGCISRRNRRSVPATPCVLQRDASRRGR